MKLIHNTGADRVIDLMRPHLKRGNQLGCVTPSFSLYALSIGNINGYSIGVEPEMFAPYTTYAFAKDPVKP